MALFSRKNIKSNPFGLTKDDLIDSIKGFPMGVVVRMLEEQELQGNRPDVEIFQIEPCTGTGGAGFDWNLADSDWSFWHNVISFKDFELFFNKYPEYVRYNLT